MFHPPSVVMNNTTVVFTNEIMKFIPYNTNKIKVTLQ